jgi:outer membrane protein OmpA-like peptidoglycan-associated protein
MGGQQRRTRDLLRVLALVALLLAGACGGGGGGGDDDGSAAKGDDETATTEAPDDDSSTTAPEVDDDDQNPLPPGATPGLDDYDGDGRKDHTCGTQDFGGGLVLRKPCESLTPNEPPEGVTLVDGSLFAYNGSTDIPLDNISGSLLLARGEAGDAVVIVTFNTDNLFEVNSSDVASPDTMDGVIALLNKRWPNSKIQVRGHTDGTGGAKANQTLSERRATSIKTYLEGHGLKAAEITTVGLGATQPFAKENSDTARQFNRRVEIVVRVAA